MKNISAIAVGNRTHVRHSRAACPGGCWVNAGCARPRRWPAALGLTLWLASFLAGQAVNARITGDVQDEEGRYLAGVEVTAINISNNATTTAFTSGEKGTFRFLGLGPGHLPGQLRPGGIPTLRGQRHLSLLGPVGDPARQAQAAAGIRGCPAASP